ncbi:cobyrinic acid a,c-diamide synthase [Desulfovibrio sp. A2]|nr:cobyrinic acid a,c-diamide synthase [Desulfovibrio sp. A2]
MTRPARPAPLPVLVVAGTHSGCGKTTAALALMAALTRRGLRVQPMKSGPDYIDPGLHAAVTGRPGWNLDGWMCGPEGVRRSFARAVRAGEPHGAPDIAIIEGVMGLHDGASADGPQGSTAEVAALLDAPVLLVADVRGMSRSAAALVAGYTRFDPSLRFAGMVCNRVGGPGHRDLLRRALDAHCPDIPLLGLLPRDATLGLPSRHLGLAQAHEHAAWPELSARLADWFEAGLDAAGQSLDGLLTRCAAMAPRDATKIATPENLTATAAKGLSEGAPRRIRIGIARDAAFSFLYPENLFLLEAAGAEPAFFSPLSDAALPPDIGGLLLPGGYPELHAPRLAANAPMLAAVRAFAALGRPVHGECGGFMYLMRSITDAEGTRHAMTGCLPAACRMDARLRALGYREAQTLRPSPFGPAGTVMRGHEFHYSHLDPAVTAGLAGAAETAKAAEADRPTPSALPAPSALPVWSLRDRNGAPLGPEGVCAGSVSGTYVHLHFGSNPAVARAFVAACAAPDPIFAPAYGDSACP